MWLQKATPSPQSDVWVSGDAFFTGSNASGPQPPPHSNHTVRGVQAGSWAVIL